MASTIAQSSSQTTTSRSGCALVEIANGWEVGALVDHLVAASDRSEAGKDDRLRDGHVLVHDGRVGRCPDDPADLIADRHGQLPPTLGPGADSTLTPRAGVLGDAILDLRGHCPKRMVDQVGGVLEDRELGSVVEQRAHHRQPSRAERATVCSDHVRGTVPQARPNVSTSQQSRPTGLSAVPAGYRRFGCPDDDAPSCRPPPCITSRPAA